MRCSGISGRCPLSAAGSSRPQIVVQSILPHSGEQSNAVNDRIRQINRQLKAIALAEDVTYLDLHPSSPTQNLR